MADETRVRHLLRRTEYVDWPPRVDALKAQGVSLQDAVDDILGTVTPVPVPAQLFNGSAYDQYVAATHWWFDRMATAPKPIHERLAFFWHGHFTSEWRKVEFSSWMLDQNALFRDNCLGDFAALTQAMALQPAMLRYLDNKDNEQGSPNQNFARELMELFTLGVGHYTEADVVAAARAWTGHTIDDDTNPKGKHVFDPAQHDPGPMTFFGETAKFDGPGIIDKIFTAKGDLVARFVVEKLWAYFASPTVAPPPPASLDPIIAAFHANWSIHDAVRSILLLEEFYAPEVMQGLVRTPVELIVALMKVTGYTAAELSVHSYTEAMGQVPFNPPNVAGWKANATWINSVSMAARADFVTNVVTHLNQDVDWLPIIGTSDANSPVSATDAAKLLGEHFGVDYSAQTQTAIASYITSERAAGADKVTFSYPINVLLLSLMAPELHLC